MPEVTQFCTEESLEEPEEQKEEEGDEVKRYVTPTDNHLFQRGDTFEIAAIPEDSEVNDDHMIEMDQRDSLMYASTNHLTN